MDVTAPRNYPATRAVPDSCREEWISVPNVHPGYITLAQHDANLARLPANAPAHGKDRLSGPARPGKDQPLLQDILICGRCGQRMTVRYHQRATGPVPTYVCQREGIANARRICTTVPGATLAERIGILLIETLTRSVSKQPSP